MTEDKCTYDYANKCDCSEDDKCGCSYPNNLPHDFECDLETPILELEDNKTSPSLVGKYAPDFTAEAVLADNSFKLNFNLYEYLKNSYGFIFFYPADFSFVCPSELLAYNRSINEFKSRNVKIIAISVDSKYVHQAWKNKSLQDGGIGDIAFPMIADTTKAVTYQYGALKKDGTAMRSSFLIDKEMVVRYHVTNDDKIGRDPAETLRIIDALQFVETHPDVCPAGWQRGDSGLNPTQEGVAKYLKEQLK